MKGIGDYILAAVVVIGLIGSYFFLRVYYPATDYIYEVVFGLVALFLIGGLIFAVWAEGDAMSYPERSRQKLQGTQNSYNPQISEPRQTPIVYNEPPKQHSRTESTSDLPDPLGIRKD